MIAAVTGGTGFVGRALVARLAATPGISEIRVLTRRAAPPGTRAFRGDLSSGSAPPTGFLVGATVLFHAAGELRRDRVMRAVHVEGTARLIESAARRVPRWVQLSSVGAYGHRSRSGVVSEDSPSDPEGEYERTKVESDRLVEQAAASGAFVAATLRPSIIFGPGMPNRSLAHLIAAVRRGVFAYIGTAPAVANYVYIDDVAEALVLCGTAPPARGVYNLSDDRPMEDFVGTIAGALGRAAPARHVPEAPLRWLGRIVGRIPGSPLTESRIDALTRNVRYPSRRIQDELGYTFTVSVEEGLRRYVASLKGGA